MPLTLLTWWIIAQPGVGLAAPVTPPAPPQRVHALTEQILRDEAYRPVRVAPWLEPWLPTIERLMDLLLSPFSHRQAGRAPWRDGLGVLAYAVVLGALGWLGAKLARRPGRRERPAALGPGPARERSAAEWRRDMEGRAAAGDHAGAFAAGYQALLRRLDETGRLPYDPARTGHETAAAVGGELAGELAILAALADTIFYGAVPAGPEAVDRCAAALTRAWSTE